MEEIMEETKEEISGSLRSRPSQGDAVGQGTQDGAPPTLRPAAVLAAASPPKVRRGPKPRAPKEPKPDPAEKTRPIRAAYLAAYDSAFGEAPAMGAADNTACKRLVDQVGPETALRLIADVYAIPSVRKRYPSIRDIASNPARVRAAIAGEALTEAETAEARTWMRTAGTHELAALLRAEKRAPTREELWRMRRERPTPIRRGPPVQEQPADGPLYDAQNDF